MKFQKMDYRMPVADLRPDLAAIYPQGTTTLDLIIAGRRTATTRSFALGQVGDIVTLYNSTLKNSPKVQVRVTRVHRTTISEAEAWSALEGWHINVFISNRYSVQGATQTEFELV